ncbi:hypothetical protein BO78DRAFT_418883 [Aspergillus sclerotiicarbonarius CBS 121057]|uniref:Uncharacterized protein n=1 Tax=Aspergillus sclerotiicarbonarius (strain CBS 121057 / IBT 28362) TaxID=1448318 RepID=A0A319ERF7_ASPSB|nr:hypothetical protein BO78DRAFT_418883 [Aspergillus sclerotiicarbonarius CBS 121057]
MKLSLITVALLGLAMAAPPEQNTGDVGITDVPDDGTIVIADCGDRCRHDRHCRGSHHRCHECHKRHGEEWGRCRRRRSDADDGDNDA